MDIIATECVHCGGQTDTAMYYHYCVDERKPYVEYRVYCTRCRKTISQKYERVVDNNLFIS